MLFADSVFVSDFSEDENGASVTITSDIDLNISMEPSIFQFDLSYREDFQEEEI